METIKRMIRQWAAERVRMEILKTPHAGYGDVAYEVERLDDVAQWVTAAPVWQWRKRLKVTKGVVTRPDDTVITTVTTKVTAKGQQYFINKFINQLKLI